jgi:hypothetical protein
MVAVSGDRCPVGPLHVHTWQDGVCIHCQGTVNQKLRALEGLWVAELALDNIVCDSAESDDERSRAEESLRDVTRLRRRLERHYAPRKER